MASQKLCRSAVLVHTLHTTPESQSTYNLSIYSIFSYYGGCEMMLLLMLMNHVLHLSFLNGIMTGARAGDHSRVNISQSVTFFAPSEHWRLCLLPDYWFTFNNTLRVNPGIVQKLIYQITKWVRKPPHHSQDKEQLWEVHVHWRISRQPPVEEEHTVDDISWYVMTLYLPMTPVLLMHGCSLGTLFSFWHEHLHPAKQPSASTQSNFTHVAASGKTIVRGS